MVGIMKVLLFMKDILQAGDNHNQSGVHFGKRLMDQVGGGLETRWLVWKDNNMCVYIWQSVKSPEQKF